MNLWHQISNTSISNLKTLKCHLSNLFGEIDDSSILWIIDDKSPYLYSSRWKPILLFIRLEHSQACELEEFLLSLRLGQLTREDDHASFVTFDDAQIRQFIGADFKPELLGKNCDILYGPLEGFQGKVISYNEESRLYIVEYKLLRSIKSMEFSLNHLNFK